MANFWDADTTVSPFDAALHLEGISGPTADLARSIYAQESSGGRNTQTSNAGAVGGMQILPATFSSVADKDWNINDPIHNARAGIRYVKQMNEAANGDPHLTAVGYYGGPGAINKARNGIAVSDPRNPSAPNTLQYANQVVSRLAKGSDTVASKLLPSANAGTEWWANDETVDPSEVNRGNIITDSAPGITVRYVDNSENQAQNQNQMPQANPADGSFGAGVWRGVSDPIDALAQMLRRSMPESVGNAVDAFGNKLADMGLPIARTNGVQGLDKLINDNNHKYEEGRKAAGRSGFDFARLGGNIAITAPLTLASGGSTASGLLPQIGKGAVTGGLFGLMSPVIGEQNQTNFTNEKLKQASLGSAFGAATPLVTNGLSRLISPKASVDPYVKLLQKEGVELTPGQALGGAFAKTEDKLMSMPILGDAISASRARGNDQLNRAVYNRVLDPINGTTNKVGRDAVEDVSRQVSKAYDDVLSRVTFTPDNAFTQQLTQLRNMATNGLPQREAEQFAKELERNVIGPLSKGKSIDGQAFKDIETQLGNRASAFLKSTDVYQQDLGNALIQVQKSLRDNLMRLNPSAAQDLQSVNQSFANLTRLQNAAGKINAENGVFTPAQLSQAVRQGDRTVRKNAYAKGEALMQDLSDAARSVMMNRVPNSGTVDRLAINAGALGSGLWNPYIPAALAGASIPYLPHAQKLATGAIINRPDTARFLAEQLKKIPAGIGGLLVNQM